MIEQVKESTEGKGSEDGAQACRELFSTLLVQLFGPNSLSHFSAKKNQDLYMPLASVLATEQITAYVEDTLIASFDAPDLETFYPDEVAGSNSASDSQKKMQIQLFALSQAACLPQTFRPPALNPQHIMLALNLLVRSAFLD